MYFSTTLVSMRNKNLIVFICRCSYDYNGVPLVFYPGKTPPYGECAGDKYVGYEEGCVYVTREEDHQVTGSIMYGRQYYEQVSF